MATAACTAGVCLLLFMLALPNSCGALMRSPHSRNVSKTTLEDDVRGTPVLVPIVARASGASAEPESNVSVELAAIQPASASTPSLLAMLIPTASCQLVSVWNHW